MTVTSRSVLKMMCVCGCVLLVAGCATRRGKRGQISDDALSPENLGQPAVAGDIAMGDRFAEGDRITDVTFESVLFDYDSFQIKPSEMPKIEKVSGYLRDNANVRLIVEGHCDERGSAEYNVALGEHRALAIRASLIGMGIDGTRIQTRSFGEEKPLDAGHSESSWSVNRRGEFALYR
jgi:peptidoglycan-associated lipoprotein